MLNMESNKPIYVQIAEWIESEILSGALKKEEKVYSQYQLAELYTINPATAAKGLNLLAEEGILFKKRGLGMFVTAEAKDIISIKRRNETVKTLIQELVTEAKRLQIGEEELIQMIKEEGKKP
jgi:GntR family transcriptional regulator